MHNGLKSEKAYEIMTGRKPFEKKEDHPHLLHFSSPQTSELLEHWKEIKLELEPLTYIKLVE